MVSWPCRHPGRTVSRSAAHAERAVTTSAIGVHRWLTSHVKASGDRATYCEAGQKSSHRLLDMPSTMKKLKDALGEKAAMKPCSASPLYLCAKPPRLLRGSADEGTTPMAVLDDRTERHGRPGASALAHLTWPVPVRSSDVVRQCSQFMACSSLHHSIAYRENSTSPLGNTCHCSLTVLGHSHAMYRHS